MTIAIIITIIIELFGVNNKIYKLIQQNVLLGSVHIPRIVLSTSV